MKGVRSRLVIWPVVLAVAALVSVLIAQTATAASTPSVTGHFSGVELCTQFICGKAVFVYHGPFEVDGKSTPGFGSIRVNHGPLPAHGGDPAAINGDSSLWTFQGSFDGSFAGTLVNNGDNTFTAAGQMTLTDGGDGTIYVEVVLDHNTFPQTVTGELSQEVPEVVAEAEPQETENEEGQARRWILAPFRWLNDLFD
jgi:hypothetical protein